MSNVLLHTGSPASDRSVRVLAAVERAWGASMLIVPDRRTARGRQRDLLERANRPGCWGQLVYSFADFTAALLRAEGLPIFQLDAYTRYLLVRRCLVLHEDAVRALGIDPERQLEGLTGHLLGVINSLKQAAITPEEFQERVTAKSAALPMDRLVATVYAAYQERLLRERYHDVPGLYWEAHLQCEAGLPRLLENISLLAFDDFDDFTPSEFRLLERLTELIPNVVLGINFNTDPDRRDLYQSVGHTIQRLAEHCNSVPKVAEEPHAQSHREFAAAHLYWRNAPGDGWQSLRPDLVVTPCTDVHHEIEVIGREIQILIRDEGVAPGAIAVTARNVTTLLPGLRAAFADYGLPLTVEGETPVAQTGVGRLLQRFFLAIGAWEAAPVLAFLQSSLLPGGGARKRQFPLLVRLARIPGGRLLWPQRLQWLEAEITRGTKRELRPWIEAVADLAGDAAALTAEVKRLEGWTQRLERAATLQEFAGVMDILLGEMGVEAALSALPPGPERVREEKALEQVRVALIQIGCECGGESAASLTEGAALLLRAIEVYGVGETVAGGVTVCDPAMLKNRRFDYVFYAAMNEGICPKHAPANSVYTEHDLQRLSAMGISLEAQWMHHARERLLFHHVLHSARIALKLYWHYLGEDGREASPSAFLTDLYAVIPEASLNQARPPATDAIVPVPAAAASLRELRNGACYQYGGEAAEVPGLATQCAHGFVLEAERQSSAAPGAHDGVLQDPALIAAIAGGFGADHTFSVAQIEGYRSCPYQFWRERILHIRDEAVDAHQLDPLVRGNVVHRILERFHRAHAGRPIGGFDGETGLKELLALVEEEFDQLDSRDLGIHPGVLHAERAGLRRRMERYFNIHCLDAASVWRPSFFEAAFGMTQGRDPAANPEALLIESAEGPLRFAGKIDRVDVDGDTLRLIDYKTGSAPSGAEITRGDSLQLSLYVWAAQQLLWPDRECVSACFLEVGRTKLVDALAGKTNSGRDENARNVIAQCVAGMRRGYFPPLPAKDSCYGCGRFHDCRHEAVRMERKSGGTDFERKNERDEDD